jgi:hypothetical protein
MGWVGPLGQYRQHPGMRAQGGGMVLAAFLFLAINP